MIEAIILTCSTCQLVSEQAADSVMVTDDHGTLHLAWSCRCGLGNWSTSDPRERALVEAVVRATPVDGLLGRPPAWPELRQRPRMAPITRLLRLLGRGPKPDA